MNDRFLLGIFSGFFNPLHAGHLECMAAAKKQCDQLFVIVNNDLQVSLKKSKPFMDEEHRKTIVAALRYVDYVMIALDSDESVALSLEGIANTFGDCSLIFFNSGDRSPMAYNEKEKETCQRRDIEQVFLNLPKIHNSRDFRK
jgi:cytidyltransferase-like protein